MRKGRRYWRREEEVLETVKTEEGKVVYWRRDETVQENEEGRR